MPKPNKINVKEKIEDNICDLSLSELKEIPVRDIASFKRVNVLDLSSNRLMSLGKNFCTLTRLVKLDLSKNQIKFLPDEFGLLKNLRHLDLYDNKLQYLPLSFGDLINLRYLDLKGNPLAEALMKVVGICTTTKECQQSAKRTVKFMSDMQLEAIKVKEQYKRELLQNHYANSVQDDIENSDKIQDLQQKTKKPKKSKNKKKVNNNQDAHVSTAVLPTNDNITIAKTNKNKKSANGSLKSSVKTKPPSTALTSLIIFLLMVAFNVVLIYMIMFKNPEIAEKIVESIPHQYRDWILTKTEIFRLHVTDWISQFRTPPEEH